MTTIDSQILATVCGGKKNRANRGETSEAYKQECTGKNAYEDYKWMLDNVIPDNANNKVGVYRRAVMATAKLCGFKPLPP